VRNHSVIASARRDRARRNTLLVDLVLQAGEFLLGLAPCRPIGAANRGGQIQSLSCDGIDTGEHPNL
jgi:hypothetical protein